MSLLGQEIKSRMTSVTYTKFQEYVDSVNAGKSPGDPGYLDIAPGDPGWPDPVSNDGISLDHINAIADPIEELVSGGLTAFRPLTDPLWDNATPLSESIEEVEPNLFRPTVTVQWQELDPILPWDSATEYFEDDLVSYSSKNYISISDNNINNLPDESESSDWRELGDADIEVRVFRQEGSGSFRYISSVSDPGTTFVDDTVTFNKTYSYRLARFDSASQFSNFSTVETIATSSFPVPSTPLNAPSLSPAAGSIGVEIENSSTGAVIDFYRVEFRSQPAASSNDGSFAVPSVNNWSAWETLAELDGTQVIHNGVSASRVYQYRYVAVSNYGIEGGYSPESVETIPFKKINRDEQNLGYYAEVFHVEVPTGDSFRPIIYSPFSIDPQSDPSVNSQLMNGTWWWQTDTGRVWTWNQTAGSWNTSNRVPLISPVSYDSLITSTITVADKATLLANYKNLIFRKLTLERFAAKIKNIQEDVGFIAIKESFISLMDSYYNALYGILTDTDNDSTNHSVNYVKAMYRDYYNTEIEFSEFLYEEYTQTLTRSFVNDNFSLSLGAVV